jgi:hypothetical protein
VRVIRAPTSTVCYRDFGHDEYGHVIAVQVHFEPSPRPSGYEIGGDLINRVTFEPPELG